MKSVVNGIIIKHNGVTCDMDCPFFQVIMGDTEDNPLQPRCSLFHDNLDDSLQRSDKCLFADKAYQRKLEIHSMRARYNRRPHMLRFLKRIDYAFDPQEAKTIKELCDKFNKYGISNEEIQKATGLSNDDFNNALSSHPYPYVVAVFKQIFNFPIGEELTLKDRLTMASKRIRTDD